MADRRLKLLGAALVGLTSMGGCSTSATPVSANVPDRVPSYSVITSAAPDSGSAMTTAESDTTGRGGVLIGSGH